MVFTAASRAKVKEHDKSWLAKFIIRSLILVCAFIALGTIAWAVAQVFSVNSDNAQYLDPGSIITAVSLGPISLAIIWSLVWMLVLAIRSKPVHPGFAVGFDLVLFLFLIIIAIITTLVTVYRGVYDYGDFYSYRRSKRSAAPTPAPQYYGYGYNDGYGTYVYNGNKLHNAHYRNLANRIYVVTLVGCSFMFVLTVLEFIIFVWACVDTHRYNRTKRDNELQALANSMMAPMLAQYQAGGYPNQQSQQDYTMQQAPPLQPQSPQQTSYAYQPVQQGFSNQPMTQVPYDQTRQTNFALGPHANLGSQDEDKQGVSNPSDTNSGAGPSSPISNPTQLYPGQPSPKGKGRAEDVNGNGSGSTWRGSYAAGPVDTTYYPPQHEYDAQ